MLLLKHLDPVTGKWIEIPNPRKGRLGEPDTAILTEELKPTILEELVRERFPENDITDWFSVGSIDELATVEEVRNHPLGHVPLLANKGRIFYGPPEVLEVVTAANIDPEKPNLMNAAAYGSTQTGGCDRSFDRPIHYLVVDRLTGENGGYLDPDTARALVSDGGGAIVPDVSEETFGTTRHLIQFRMLDRDRSWYMKGTVSAENFALVKPTPDGEPITLVISTDSAKGAAKTRVEPGLYSGRVWFGEKERSKRGTMAMSQPLADSVEAFRDRLPEIERSLGELKEILSDPRLLSKDFVEKYERRAKKVNEGWEPPSPTEAVERYRRAVERGGIETGADTEGESKIHEDFIYLSLKAYPELESHPFLGIPKFRQTLTEFVKDRFLSTATGRIHEADRGMAMATGELKHGEVCVPWLPDGETLLGWRSPYLNYNGQRVFTNRHVNTMHAPDGSLREGVILINDDSWGEVATRIHATATAGIEALRESGKAIDGIELPPLPGNTAELDAMEVADRIAYVDRFNGIVASLNETGATLPKLPYESDIEAMALDFDGDCLGAIAARDVPRYYREQVERLRDNPFPPTTKRAKVPVPPGTSFEEVVIHASDGISVGTINNLLQTVTSLQAEMTLFDRYGGSLRDEYAGVLRDHATSVLAKREDPKRPIFIPGELIGEFEAIAGADLDSAAGVNGAYARMKTVYRFLVRELCTHNQDAVDLFKSWFKPDIEGVNSLSPLLYRRVENIKDKKNEAVFVNRPLAVTGYTPHELSSRMANDAFRGNRLESYPLHGFRSFAPADYTGYHTAAVKEVKERYDTLFNHATREAKRASIEQGHLFKLRTDGGKEFEVTNYKYFLTHAEAREIAAAGHLTLTLADNDHYRTADSHKLVALATLPDGKIKPLGTVAEADRERLKLELGERFEVEAIEVSRPLSADERSLLFEAARSIVREWREEIDRRYSPAEIDRYFNAAWHHCTREDATNANRVNNFVFDAFGDRILERLATGEYPYTSFVATGISGPANRAPEGLWRTGEPVNLKVGIDSGDGKRYWYVGETETGEYHRFANVSDRSYVLPSKTTVTGRVQGDLTTTAYLEIEGLDERVGFGNLDKFQGAARDYGDGEYTVVFKKGKTPEQPFIYEGEEKIGKLSPDSVALLKEAGRYKEGTLELTLVPDGREGYPKWKGYGDDLPPLEILPLYRGQALGDDRASIIRLAIESPKREMMGVYLKGEDGQLTGIGQFTNNWNASKEILTRAGLFKEGTEVRARIVPRLTAVTIDIDRGTLNFPPLGEIERGTAAEIGLENVSVDPVARHFIDTLSRQATVRFSREGVWNVNGEVRVLPTIGVSIDVRNATRFEEKLKALNVPRAIVHPDDASGNEIDKGLVTFLMVPSDLSPRALAYLDNLSPEILDADATLTEESDYGRFVADLSEPSSSEREEIAKALESLKERGVFAEPDTVTLREVPTLIATEEYDRLQPDGSYLTEPVRKLAVARRNLERVESTLTQYGVRFEVATDPEDTAREDASGYAVVRFRFEDIPERLDTLLRTKFGEPLDANAGGDYWRRLDEIDNGFPSIVARTPIAPEPTRVLPFSKEPRATVKTGKENGGTTERPVNLNNPLPMSYPLLWPDGENPHLPLATTADALRYGSRCHTTRFYDPGARHGFKPGDLAVASDGTGGSIAFRAGRQYRLDVAMVADANFRAEWSRKEMHHPDALLDLWKEAVRRAGERGTEPVLFGQEMTAIGEWNGKRVIPFPPFNGKRVKREGGEKKMETDSREVGKPKPRAAAKEREEPAPRKGTIAFGKESVGVIDDPDTLYLPPGAADDAATVGKIREWVERRGIGEITVAGKATTDPGSEAPPEADRGERFREVLRESLAPYTVNVPVNKSPKPATTGGETEETGIEYTAGQKEALRRMTEWARARPTSNPSDNIFLLQGYAGTGKSLVVSHWSAALEKVSPVYTAPTHKALGVGRSLISAAVNGENSPDTRTLQSLLKVRRGIIPGQNQAGFVRSRLKDEDIDKIPPLVIVDETSMVSGETWKALVELAGRGKKILLVGDPGQIRPVNDSGKSPLFTDPVIRHRATLTEVARYSNEQGYLATALRDDRGEERLPIAPSPDGSVRALSGKVWMAEILEAFASEEYRQDPNYFQVYTYTNKRVAEINVAVRERLYGPKPPQFAVGETIVAKDTVYAMSARAGESPAVALQNEAEARIARVSEPFTDANGLKCIAISLADPTPGTETTIKVVTAGDRTKLEKLVSEKESAWKKERNSTSKERLFEEAEAFKKGYANVLHAYAATFHASQGSTKTRVAVDEESLNWVFGKRLAGAGDDAERADILEERDELLYVAVTRAREGIVVYNKAADEALRSGKGFEGRPWYLPPNVTNLVTSPAENTADVGKAISEKEGNAKKRGASVIEGDLLSLSRGVLVHQVNCRGVFGSDSPAPNSTNLATAIRHHADWMEEGKSGSLVYEAYRAKYEGEGWKLGDIQPVATSDTLHVINMAGQEGFGEGRVHTDSAAFRLGLERAAAYASERGLPLYLPEGIGSGLGGGDRALLRDIIDEVCPEAILVRFSGSRKTVAAAEVPAPPSTSPVVEKTEPPEKPRPIIGSKKTAPPPGKPEDPYLLVPDVPGKPKVNANRVKDREMAALADKFIGFPVNDNAFSSTRDYRDNWNQYGLANTGEYTAGETIIVSGNGPWRGVTEGGIRETFENRYVPELERAIEAGVRFAVGNAPGTDRLVVDYLQGRGYDLTDTGKGYYRAEPRALESSPSIEGMTDEGETPIETENRKAIGVGAPPATEPVTVLENGTTDEPAIPSSVPRAAETAPVTENIVDPPAVEEAKEVGEVVSSEPEPASFTGSVRETFPPEIAPAFGGSRKEKGEEPEMMTPARPDTPLSGSAEPETVPPARTESTPDGTTPVNPVTEPAAVNALEEIARQSEPVSPLGIVNGSEALLQADRERRKNVVNPLISELNVNGQSATPIGSVASSRDRRTVESTIPITRAYMPENLKVQQERTELVAPVAAAFLRAHNLMDSPGIDFDDSTGTLTYTGERYAVSWDGTELKVGDNDSGEVKMVAVAARDGEGETRYVARPIPGGGDGLTETDVQRWTAPELSVKIKEAILRHDTARRDELVATNGKAR
jgi:AAA domain